MSRKRVFLCILSLLMAPGSAAAGSFQCSRIFAPLVAGFKKNTVIRVKSPSEIKLMQDRPENFWIEEQDSLSRKQVQELSEMGYVRDFSSRKKGLMLYYREPVLMSDREAHSLPVQIQRQREQWMTHFGEPWGSLRASTREKNFSEVPEYDHLLTAKTLKTIPPGRYSFVVLEGENFLRLGMGHHRLGARMPVSSAGEVLIEKDPQSGTSYLAAVNRRSDTYRPMASDLLPALDALWRQGVFQKKLKIFDWDLQTLLLELE